MNSKQNFSQKLFIGMIGFYQKLLSPGLGRNCRFYPSCSSYTALAIEKYGTIKGMTKSFWRILRCNPYSKGGINLP
ncbi:MAG: membrane protein insertion efficiency factor YidD [Candidatus Nealsonbacteria bacterium]|nr:membrane protein insertion efficiency factor YidD [Candidatus Nealsonbacteria bacterium]